ncbi:MAG: substrate-binding domain-containing protein [Planctomycetota bacterium]
MTHSAKPSGASFHNRVREFRLKRGWSQDELALRTGLSRPGISAIEVGRTIPATTAALALARALECRVEDLFLFGGPAGEPAGWAWQPQREPCRYWRAAVGPQTRLYPVEALLSAAVAHDGLWRDGAPIDSRSTAPPTLVIATCDPAVGVLAEELWQSQGVRVLAFSRPSQEALALLAQGVVQAAGIHFAERERRDRNAAAARAVLGGNGMLVHVARWNEGIASHPGLHVRSLRELFAGQVRWVGRQAGSAARDLQDELLGDRRPPRRLAFGHRGVAEAVRNGWADAGVCLQLASEEAGLDFLNVHEEPYDFCIRADMEGDPMIRHLLTALRSHSYRRVLNELPGYSARDLGEVQSLA